MSDEFEPWGRILRRERRLREDTQVYVANYVGVKQATLSLWELESKPPESDETVRKLASYLKMPVGDLREKIAHTTLIQREKKLSAELGKVRQKLNAFQMP